MTTVQEYIKAKIAEGLVDRGVPWHLVHCAICGEPGPSVDHRCPDFPMRLKGIGSL